MLLTYGSEQRWRHMATIEVGSDVADFAHLIQDDTLKFQVEPAGKSPPGVQWFLLFMDLSTGERRAARTAWAVLTALRDAAAAGCLDRFRVVSGMQWLSLDRADPAATLHVMRQHAESSVMHGATLCAR